MLTMQRGFASRDRGRSGRRANRPLRRACAPREPAENALPRVAPAAEPPGEARALSHAAGPCAAHARAWRRTRAPGGLSPPRLRSLSRSRLPWNVATRTRSLENSPCGRRGDQARDLRAAGVAAEGAHRVAAPRGASSLYGLRYLVPCGADGRLGGAGTRARPAAAPRRRARGGQPRGGHAVDARGGARG